METILISDNLPQFYKNAVNNMIDAIKNAENEIYNNNKELEDDDDEAFIKRRKPFVEFCQKFTIIPELWKCEWSCRYVDKIFADCLKLRFMHHNDISIDDVFHDCEMVKENPLFKKKLLTFDDEVFKDIVYYRMKKSRYWSMPYGYRWSNVQNRRICLNELKAALQFPNRELKIFMQEYLAFSDSPLENSILKKYNKSLLIYEKISTIDDDNFEEWFQCLLEVDDEEFVSVNVEYRIGSDPGNQGLWKLYIDYLNNRNALKVLNVYRNYCRLFFEDSFFRGKYYKTIEKFAELDYDVSKWYIDAVSIECDFVSVQTAANLLLKALQMLTKRSDVLSKFANDFMEQHGYINEITPSLMKHQLIHKKFEENEMLCEKTEDDNISIEDLQNAIETFKDNVAAQVELFKKFPKPLFKYLLNQIYDRFDLYIKLIKTCKYFFIRNDCIVPLWNLTFNVNSGETVMYNEYSIHFNTANVLKLNDLLFKARIWMGRHFEFDLRLNSKIINSIAKSDIRYLNLYGERLLFDEYIVLSKNQKIEKLNLSVREVVSNSKDTYITLNDIIKYVPIATNVTIKCLQMSKDQDHKELLQINQVKKLKQFLIYCPKVIFEPLYFFEFVKKNAAATEALFQIFYDNDINEDEYQKLENIEKMFAQWSPKENAPRFLKNMF